MEWRGVRRLAPAVILLTAWLCGCDDGSQKGRFSVSGSSSRSVAKVTGSFTVVHGDPLPPAAQSTGTQPLLYLLVLFPSVRATGASTSSEEGAYVSTYRESWRTPQGDVAVEVKWDRSKDTVTAGGATFDRQRGNVFVVVRDASGKLTVTQAGPVDAGLDEFAALPKIQGLLPADSPAKDVALVR
jgi:hypothetical protein